MQPGSARVCPSPLGSGKEEFLSEFYDSRRSVISDLSALSGFALGVLIASGFAWRVLATGFRTGELERALFYFLSIVLASGLVGGGLGLWSGRIGGRIWEGRHKRHRPAESVAEAPMPVMETGSLANAEEIDEALGLTFRRFGVEVDQFLVLLRRARPAEPNAVRSATNLSRTINIGAYDGARLVGAVRVLTDGRFSHIAEVLVDPSYESRGLEAALRERASRWVS